jgi:hypothetical protein
MATKQQEMTKAIVKAVTKALATTNGHRSKPQTKAVAKRVTARVVRKGHAGRNGKHSDFCKGERLGLHCCAVLPNGRKCGYCLDMYVCWRHWLDIFQGPVCRQCFDAAMEEKNIARRKTAQLARRW